MIPINGQKLALVNRKPEDSLRYKTVSTSGWWLIKTKEIQEDVNYSKEELDIIKNFIKALWMRGYRKTMEQLVRATKDKSLIECFYRSSTVFDFMSTNHGPEVTKEIPEDLYQKRRYSVYRLCQELVGKEISVSKNWVGDYKRITSGKTVICPEEEWVEVRSIVFNQKRANVSLYLGPHGSRCIIKDGTLNMRYLAVKIDKLPKELKKACVMNLLGDNEYLLDLSLLPITSRADFGRRLTSRQLIDAVANLEYAKLARSQYSQKDTSEGKVITYEHKHKKHSTYKATFLRIDVTYKWTKLQGDQGKNWDEEYEKYRKLKSKLVFEIFAKKLCFFQEPGSPCVVGCKRSVKVGPEKILINVKIKDFLNKEV